MNPTSSWLFALENEVLTAGAIGTKEYVVLADSSYVLEWHINPSPGQLAQEQAAVGEQDGQELDDGNGKQNKQNADAEHENPSPRCPPKVFITALRAYACCCLTIVVLALRKAPLTHEA
jgi:hypothetical protein